MVARPQDSFGIFPYKRLGVPLSPSVGGFPSTTVQRLHRMKLPKHIDWAGPYETPGQWPPPRVGTTAIWKPILLVPSSAQFSSFTENKSFSLRIFLRSFLFNLTAADVGAEKSEGSDESTNRKQHHPRRPKANRHRRSAAPEFVHLETLTWLGRIQNPWIRIKNGKQLLEMSTFTILGEIRQIIICNICPHKNDGLVVALRLSFHPSLSARRVQDGQRAWTVIVSAHHSHGGLGWPEL
nr:hypothetical protein Iba_chr09aCG11900 [Ipomoea batatas]